MRVALDGTPLLIPQTGVGRYTRELGRALARCDPAVDVSYLYGIHGIYQLRNILTRAMGGRLPDRPLVAGPRPGPPWARAVPEFLKKRIKDAAADLEYRFRRPQVYHATNFIACRWDRPVVATIHDLSFIRYPETHPRERLDWIARGLPRTLEQAHLIAVSHFTKREIVELLPVGEDRVSVVYEGIDPRFKPIAGPCCAANLGRYGLTPGEYILAVGTLEPRKNLVRLIDAYQQLPDALVRRHPLAIAGISGWKDESIFEALQPLRDQGRLRLLGYVPDADLPMLYSGAALFVFPSLYEGFGFPPLEAMACGTAALVSNRASLPEVVGAAAMLCNPEDSTEIADKMRRLLEDQQLRQSLGRQGVRQAGGFTWEACARQTLAVYRRLLHEA